MKDMQIEILNKAKCVNDYFSVAKVEHDEYYQLSFLAFAFDGEDAFDMVSSITKCYVINYIIKLF